MASLNKVMLIGRLTRDPEARYLPSGVAVTEFGFAVNRYYLQNNERKEDTCFLEVSVWGRQGEQARNYLKKGSQAFIEGHLTFNQWQTKEGQKRSQIRVVAEQQKGDKTAGGSASPFVPQPLKRGSSPPPPPH